MKKPHLCYLTNGDPHTIQARGGRPFYQLMRERGLTVTMGNQLPAYMVERRWWRRRQMRMYIPYTYLLVQVPAIQPVVDFIELCQQHGGRVVVDVPGPVLRPEYMAGEVPRRFWSDPEAQAVARRAIKAADAVTTSHAWWHIPPDSDDPDKEPYYQWMEDLQTLNPCSVRLADVTGEVSLSLFTHKLCQLWRLGLDADV